MKTVEQRLLVEDGKLYGRDPLFGVITRAAAVPDSIRNHDMQKHESIVHLGQVKPIIMFGTSYTSFCFCIFLWGDHSLILFLVLLWGIKG